MNSTASEGSTLKRTQKKSFLNNRLLLHLPRLFLSHVDAWCVTLVAAGLPLLIHNAFSRQTLYLLTAIVGMYWLGFALNDWYDAPQDAQDHKKGGRNFFVKVALSGWQMTVLVVIGLALLLPGVLQFGWRGWLLACIGSFVMWAYSAPPLRVKNRPILDLITHTFFVESFPYWMVLFLLNLQWRPLDWTLLAMALLGSLTAQLEQQARDYAIDRLTERNFTTVYSLPNTIFLLRLATGLLIIIGVAGPLVGIIPWYFVPIEVLAVPMMARRFVQQEWHPAAQRLIYMSAGLAAVYFVGLVVWMG